MLKKVRQGLVDDGLITDPNSPKGRLLKAAAHLFRYKGYPRTTVRDLGKEVGILSGSLFHHYKTKDDILKAVMTECIILVTHQLKYTLAKKSDPRDRLLFLIRSEMEELLADTSDGGPVVVNEWRCLSESGQADILKLRDDYEKIWWDELANAQKSSIGVVDMDVVLLRRLIAGSIASCINWFQLDGDLSIDDLAAEVIKLILKK